MYCATRPQDFKGTNRASLDEVKAKTSSKARKLERERMPEVLEVLEE